MKTKYLMILVSAVLLVSGCIKEKSELPGRTTLKARLEATGTRVSIGNYDGKLTWNEGDEIAVHVGNAYQDVTIDPTSEELSITETETNYRNYYAVYPASVAVAGDYGNPDLKVTLPSSYDISDIVAGTTTTQTEDFAPLPMVADNDRDNSILYFYHVGGLLRVTLNGVKPATKCVRITFDKDVTGTYTVSNPGTENPTITTLGNSTDNVVTFTLTSSNELGATLAAGAIVLNVPVPCGSYDWVKVECLNSSNTVIASKTYDEKTRTFQRHHGKRLSDNDLSFDFTFGTLSDVELTYTGGTANLSDAFVSYKSNDGGTTKTAVPFTLEYSEDGTNWYSAAPAWLDASAVVLDGSTSGASVALTAAAQVNSATIENDPKHIELAKSERARTNFDLSTFDVSTTKWEDNQTTSVARTTANCYVVQGSGSYKFPLVYGNGVVGGAVNESAYRAKNGAMYRPDDGEVKNPGTAKEYSLLGSFKDHLNGNIYNDGDAYSSPYLTTHLGKSAADFTAVLIWEDVQGLVTGCDIDGSGENTYLTFNVPSATITQGNALVAVLVDGKIAWSWHIWVTDDDLTAVYVSQYDETIARVNIGWCDMKRIELYAPRTCQIRAVQDGSGKTASATVSETEFEVKIRSNSPYYQIGRKDPLLARSGYADNGYNNIKTYYPSDPAYAPSLSAGSRTIGDAIQNPYLFITTSPYENWCSTVYVNLWSSSLKKAWDTTPSDSAILGNGEKTKTIYDPSPVGYRIPNRTTTNNFNGLRTSSYYDEPGAKYSPGGLNIFFPSVGYRNANGNIYYQPGIYWISTTPAYAPSNTYFGNYCLSVGDNSSTQSIAFPSCAYSIRSVKEE